MSTPKALKNYVAGEFIETDQLFDNISPVDGTLVSKVAETDEELVDKVVNSEPLTICIKH